MAQEKTTLVFKLKSGSSTAIYFDIDDLTESIKLEIDGLPESDLEHIEFEISAGRMTEKELDELPEFDGF